MKKKSIAMAAAATAASTGAVLMAAKKVQQKNKEQKVKKEEDIKNYRNTELGKHDKNKKGIYYTNGNYEAFARPKKPEGVEDKHAYLIGSGLASLAAGMFPCS